MDKSDEELISCLTPIKDSPQQYQEGESMQMSRMLGKIAMLEQQLQSTKKQLYEALNSNHTYRIIINSGGEYTRKWQSSMQRYFKETFEEARQLVRKKQQECRQRLHEAFLAHREVSQENRFFAQQILRLGQIIRDYEFKRFLPQPKSDKSDKSETPKEASSNEEQSSKVQDLNQTQKKKNWTNLCLKKVSHQQSFIPSEPFSAVQRFRRERRNPLEEEFEKK